jgi:hypothetical protein
MQGPQRRQPMKRGLRLPAESDAGEYRPRSWRSVHHENGVTVYAEEEGADGEGGAIMVSAVVRASPEETFKVGLQPSPVSSTMLCRGSGCLGFG